MNEILGAVAFIREKLLGPSDAQSRNADQNSLRALVGERVYAGSAPAQNPATNLRPVFPIVILSVRSATDKTVVAGASAFVSLVVDVKAVGTGSYSDLSPIDDLIFKILQQSGGVYQNLEIMGCYREQSIFMDQVDNNTTYRNMVQSFRVRVSRINP